MAKILAEARTETLPVGNAYFPELEVEATIWRNVVDHDHCGRYWTAVDGDGIHWVHDGEHRFAVLPGRTFRFYRSGVAARCITLAHRYLRGLVPILRGAAVINFGANVGELAAILASNGAKVLAIEPDPSIVPYLRANAAGRSIEVVPVAAWNTDTDVNLYLRSESADSSLFNTAESSATVPGRRIDTLVAEHGIDRVHLLIGDAEGAEPEVLEGARETLKRTSYVSVCASAERCGERTLEACEAILKDAGFDILLREETKFCMLVGQKALEAA